MLTIQPTGITQNSSKVLAFKGEDNLLDEETYNKKRSFYNNQKDECDEILNDQYVPEGMKKGVKICKIASEGILEGWAVTWAAAKGAKIAKSSVVKALNSKVAKGAGEIFKPLGKGIKEAGKNLRASILKGFNNFKESKFITNISKQLTKLETKLDKSSAGKVVVNIVKGIGKGFKAVGNGISTLAHKIAQPFKKLTYEKATKAGSTTLGVGSGIAGAYNAAREPEKNNEKTERNDRFKENTTDHDFADEVERYEQELVEDEE